MAEHILTSFLVIGSALVALGLMSLILASDYFGKTFAKLVILITVAVTLALIVHAQLGSLLSISAILSN